MQETARYILTVNSGSSSIKCSVYTTENTDTPITSGAIEGIGLSDVYMRIHNGQQTERVALKNTTTHEEALAQLVAKLVPQDAGTLSAIGYRVVHGGTLFEAPTRVDAQVLHSIGTLAHLAPEHLPAQLACMKALTQQFPSSIHVACFDTAFHYHMPRVARLTTLPRKYEALGLRRYGFHGLSYEYLHTAYSKKYPDHAQHKVIYAHLGNGASVCAVKNDTSYDTSMGLTPTSGIMMSTRAGDIDPGIAPFLEATADVSNTEFNTLVHTASGLLGVSGTSGDMRKLLENEATDNSAAEAVALFCYTVKKYIGAYSAVLGGIDALVFSGGIGEQSPIIRERICAGLAYLGITIVPTRNTANADVISSEGATVTVLVMPTHEDQILAEHVMTFIS